MGTPLNPTAPRKLLDVTRIRALGWKPRIDLNRGIREVYEWLTEHLAEAWTSSYL